ncbi:MAG: DUF6680 family protein [Sedimentisphaerales bacterium]
MTTSDWLVLTNSVCVIVAIIVAPILAIRVENIIESKKEEKERKLRIFKALMATRATRVSPQHVEALNMIDIEFFGCKKITDAWKLLLDHFSNYPQDTKDPNYQTRLDACTEKADELFADLLSEMAQALNYTFDKVHIKRGAYIPKGHTDYMQNQTFIQSRIVDVLKGDIPIPIKIVTKKEDDSKQEEAKIN